MLCGPCSGPAVLTVDGITITHLVLLGLGGAGKETAIPATGIGTNVDGNGIPLSCHQEGPPAMIPNTPLEFVIQGEIDLYSL